MEAETLKARFALNILQESIIVVKLHVWVAIYHPTSSNKHGCPLSEFDFGPSNVEKSLDNHKMQIVFDNQLKLSAKEDDDRYVFNLAKGSNVDVWALTMSRLKV